MEVVVVEVEIEPDLRVDKIFSIIKTSIAMIIIT
jgi:hypothetical protein